VNKREVEKMLNEGLKGAEVTFKGGKKHHKFEVQKGEMKTTLVFSKTPKGRHLHHYVLKDISRLNKMGVQE